jgi:hypothetical protein
VEGKLIHLPPHVTLGPTPTPAASLISFRSPVIWARRKALRLCSLLHTAHPIGTSLDLRTAHNQLVRFGVEDLCLHPWPHTSRSQHTGSLALTSSLSTPIDTLCATRTPHPLLFCLGLASTYALPTLSAHVPLQTLLHHTNVVPCRRAVPKGCCGQALCLLQWRVQHNDVGDVGKCVYVAPPLLSFLLASPCTTLARGGSGGGGLVWMSL